MTIERLQITVVISIGIHNTVFFSTIDVKIFINSKKKKKQKKKNAHSI